MSGRYRPQRRSQRGLTGMSVLRRVSVVGCTAITSFGVVGAVSTVPSQVVPEAGDVAKAHREDQVSRSSDRGARWIGGVAVRPDATDDAESGQNEGAGQDERGDSSATSGPTAEPTSQPDRKPDPAAELPKKSGSGKRVVFDISGQQVWLVGGDGDVSRTYMVSGSRFDQLPTGTFEVFSRSRNTSSWSGSATMEYMVRFYEGENAAIGFHDLPVDPSTGEEVQTLSELGTPLSDGCIRQAEDDAKALWNFADVGTTVVVVRT